MKKKKSIWIVSILIGVVIIGIGAYLINLHNTNKASFIQNKDWNVKIDKYGISHIEGDSKLDAIEAMGYMNAKDRLFQMDYFRRFITGKLSVVYGVGTLQTDLEMIKYDFESIASAVVLQLNQEDRERLEAYCKGVNKFIDKDKLSYEFEKFEYKPDYWTPKSSVLVMAYMHYILNYRNFQDEIMMTTLKYNIPEELYYFYTPDMDRYSQITLFGNKGRRNVNEFPDIQLRELYQKATTIKNNKKYQLRALIDRSYPIEVVFEGEKSIDNFRKAYINKKLVVDFNYEGENIRIAFTIDEEMSKKIEEIDNSTKEIHIEGNLASYIKDLFLGDPNKFNVKAIIDLNLTNFQGKGSIKIEDNDYYVMTDYNLPYGSNCWIVSGDNSESGNPIIANDPHLPFMFPNIFYQLSMEYKDNYVKGFMVPGMPFIVSGNNENVCWGITSTASDFMDFIVVDPDQDETYEENQKTIRANILKWKGLEEDVTIRKTKYGPLLENKLQGKNVSIKWTAFDPAAYDFSFAKIEEANSVKKAMNIVQNAGCSPVNILLGDIQGNIAWTIAGKVPKRIGIIGDSAEKWEEGIKFWDNYIESDKKPYILNPEEGFIVNANDQVIGNQYPYVIGNDFANGWRTKRISDLLGAKDKLNERDMYDIQKDTRCDPYDYYYQLIQSTIPCLKEEEEKDLKIVLTLLEDWEKKANKENQAMLVVKYFRSELITKTLAPIYYVLDESSPFFKYSWYKVDEMVTELWYDEEFYSKEVAEFYNSPDREHFFISLLYQVKNDLIQLSDNQDISVDKLTWGDLNRFEPILESLRFTDSNIFMKYHQNKKIDEIPLNGSSSSVNASFISGGPLFRSITDLAEPRKVLVNQMGGNYGSLFDSNNYIQLNEAWGKGDVIEIINE